MVIVFEYYKRSLCLLIVDLIEAEVVYVSLITRALNLFPQAGHARCAFFHRSFVNCQLLSVHCHLQINAKLNAGFLIFLFAAA